MLSGNVINDYHALGYELHFWRTKHGLEIDFVLYGPRGLLALEIKRSSAVTPSDLRALREFKKDYPAASCMLLYGGEQPLFMGDVRVVPIRDALRGLDGLIGAAAGARTASAGA